MISLSGGDLYSLLLEMAAVPSVSFSGGENVAADYIFSRLAELEYFQRNPSFLRKLPAAGDPLGRSAVAGLVKVSPEMKQTVILTGHFDVVDTEAYGALKHLAFSPEELTRRVGELDIPEEARSDLATGEYLFGRGVSDMKSGLAVEMGLLAEISRTGDFPANILFLAVPDEENTSAGMRGAVPWLVKLREEWGIEYSAALNGEPSVGGRERPAGTVYVGTIGKIMPFFLLVGKEAHVGDYFEGVSSSLLAAHLALILEGAASTSEEREGKSFPPMACLRFRDLVKNYSVTLPERAVAYYNLLTVKKTPAEVLREMKAAAGEALEKALGRISEQNSVIGSRGGSASKTQRFVPRVMDYAELLARANTRNSDLAGLTERFLSSLPPSLDERERCVETASYLLDLAGEKGPLIVTGFLPPYYPPRLNHGRTGGERAVLRAVARLREDGKTFGMDITAADVFPGIMDLSYFGFQGDPDDLDALGDNMPLWGNEYRFPLEDLKKLDIPVANFGPVGKDDHKNGERIFLPYFLDTFPGLFRNFARYLAEESAGD
ncbi:MAG: M20/M25/M40 family metallo-hydrolase [Aminivibrio sp.]|jgi:arginine utilization protein RocB|nr:M20/M25/M40 family metallo-hydrolase [Aminivibrio sp.]